MLCKDISFFDPLTLPSRPPPLSPRGSSGTAGETFPHRDGATGSEDQRLSKRVLLWSVYVRDTTATMFYIFSYVQNTKTDLTCKSSVT